jgi:hypothetical protein
MIDLSFTKIITRSKEIKATMSHLPHPNKTSFLIPDFSENIATVISMCRYIPSVKIHM